MHVWFQLYKKYYIADCPLFPQSYSSCSVFMIAFFEHPWFWNFGSFYYLIYACSVSIIELFLAMEEKRTDPVLAAPTWVGSGEGITEASITAAFAERLR